MKRLIAINERGIRIGEDHQGAKLTNAEVERLLELRDEGLTYQQLAEIFEISKSGVRHICKGVNRCQAVVRCKQVIC